MSESDRRGGQTMRRNTDISTRYVAEHLSRLNRPGFPADSDC